MNTVKFKCWDNMGSLWVEDFAVSPNGTPLYFNEETYEESDDWEPILVRWTGLTDRHGKEIYEGDIVKTEHGATGIVIWREEHAGFGFDTKEPMWSHPINGMDGEKEVIGNIYENPELLK